MNNLNPLKRGKMTSPYDFGLATRDSISIVSNGKIRIEPDDRSTYVHEEVQSNLRHYDAVSGTDLGSSRRRCLFRRSLLMSTTRSDKR